MTQTCLRVSTARLLSCLSLVLVITSRVHADIALVGANNAEDTDGGKRFNSVMGISGAFKVLGDAINFIPSLLHYGLDGVPTKLVTKVVFTVEKQLQQGAVAITFGTGSPGEFQIQFNAPSADNYEGIKGVIYHEMAHVWQYFGQGTPSGVTEGVADYVRLKAGLAPSHWVKPGGGDRWDQGYDVTAYFFDYCNSLRGDFVWQINARLANGAWSESVFSDLLGKSVQDLWTDYKNKYGG
ncbi:hypothetical protein SELMODRAFT_104167 [Selaginella moellendorffii]|uniref:Uncharacterized protein n=1 Tax=Selaginella moellendorffii TaxID=88036 RepID=D8RYF6_SELML|nr:uncharacterized protein LOC9645876 [Selaginella moellendorffii]EFJ23092.1 hypothetical protein SELMODRAFT_104167 [Selaginella moellendorffii]|eukprot:XP_002976187.1 uncharacterized protein LOC9645876 [Selaginella moellendorffii]